MITLQRSQFYTLTWNSFTFCLVHEPWNPEKTYKKSRFRAYFLFEMKMGFRNQNGIYVKRYLYIGIILSHLILFHSRNNKLRSNISNKHICMYLCTYNRPNIMFITHFTIAQFCRERTLRSFISIPHVMRKLLLCSWGWNPGMKRWNIFHIFNSIFLLFIAFTSSTINYYIFILYSLKEKWKMFHSLFLQPLKCY